MALPRVGAATSSLDSAVLQALRAQPAGPKPFSLTDLIAIVGGSVGLVYLVGYLVLASHQRALGVPVSGTDAPILIANAWDFGFRGSLMTFTTVVRWTTGWLSNLWLTTGVVVASAVVPTIFWKYPRLRHRALAMGRVPSWTIALVAISGGAWHLGYNSVPLTGVQDLLFAPTQVSPFENLPPWPGRQLTRRWASLQSMLIEPEADTGRATGGNPNRRAGFVALHVILTLALFAAFLYLRRRADDTLLGRLSRGSVLTLAIVHGLFAPISYGVLLKTYRYPQVQITVTPSGHPEIDQLYEDYPFLLPFLIEATDDDLYLYFQGSRQIAVVRRERLAQLRIVGSDLVLGAN